MTALATETLTAEQLVKVAREQIEAFNDSDWERMQAGLAADATYHELATQRKVNGPEKIVEINQGWKTAFPDAGGTVTSAIASGTTAVLEVTWKGTQTGPLVTAEGTIPASSRRGTPRSASSPLRAARSRKSHVLRLAEPPQADRRTAQVRRRGEEDRERGGRRGGRPSWPGWPVAARTGRSSLHSHDGSQSPAGEIVGGSPSRGGSDGWCREA